MELKRDAAIREIVGYVNAEGASVGFLEVLLRKFWNEAVETGMQKVYATSKKTGGTEETPKGNE